MKEILFIIPMLIFVVSPPVHSEERSSWPCKDNLQVDYAKTVKSIEAKIYYRVRGEDDDNPTLIYLSGLGCSYFPFRESLAKLESKFTIVYLDIRGSGKSDKADGLEHYCFANYLQDIENVRKALKVKKIYIAGHSHMGMLAAEYALQYPQQVEGLIFDSGSPIDFKGQSIDNLTTALNVIKNDKDQSNDAFISGIVAAIENIKKGRFSENDKNALMSTRKFLGHLRDPRKIQAAWKHALDGLVQSNEYELADCSSSPYAEQGLYDAVEIRGMKLMDYTILNRLDKIEAKTLMLLGKKDTLVGEKWAKRFTKGIKDSKLIILENSGHIPLVDEPERVIAEIETFYFD